mgnify:CR=1 FL=1
MGNAVTAKKGTIGNKTFAVSGDTLEEIQDSLFANQLKGSTDAVGDCKTGISTPKITNFIEKESKKPKKKGTTEITITAKPGKKVELTGTITLPALKSDKKLSAKGKAEWKRFYGALKSHEDDHVAEVWKLTQTIADELSALEGKGVGKDKDAALKAAKADYKKQYAKAFSDSAIMARVTKAHATVDSKGNTFTLDVNKQ